ncbi:hypothetical protein ZWY2020_040929 [Hordeum vulgare]|nr:hypothetical protein ZWY2020_040929 [Hordeum vulgare]
MDRDCFNLVIRKIMFHDIRTAQKTKQLIAKHYLDMKFWVGSEGREGRMGRGNTVSAITGRRYAAASCGPRASMVDGITRWIHGAPSVEEHHRE